MLTSDDIDLLQKIQADPLRSLAYFKRNLQKSLPTLKKRLKELEERYSSNNQPFFNTVADINYEALGLELIDTYVELNSISKFPLVEKVLKNHEYIKFIGRGIGLGKETGFFAQFTIPKGTIGKLDKVLNSLKKHDLVNNYQFFKKTPYILNNPPKLDIWDTQNHKWKLNDKKIEDWFKKVNNQPESIPVISKVNFDISKMTKTHLIILEELTWDARRSDRTIFSQRGGRLSSGNKDDLTEFYGKEYRSDLSLEVSFSTFARKMNEIDPRRTTLLGYNDVNIKSIPKGIIDGYRLHYSANVFSIFDTCIFRGKTTNTKILNQFFNLIRNEPLGLRMNFSLYENGEFMWYMPIPNQYFNAFVNGLLNYITEDFQLIWLNYGSTWNPPFWPINFDLDAKKWKKTSDWMIENPLKLLESTF